MLCVMCNMEGLLGPKLGLPWGEGGQGGKHMWTSRTLTQYSRTTVAPLNSFRPPYFLIWTEALDCPG